MSGNGVTLRTIALRAGVHPSTVSRALNPLEARRVNARTAERIRRLARELEYEPHHWARSLRTNRTLTVGLVLPRLVDGTLALIFEASQALARSNGYQAITVSTGDDPEEERRVVDQLVERRVDGMILATAAQVDPVIDELATRRVPFVLINRASGPHPVVRGDDRDGALQATSRLIERGHRRIGLITGPPQFSTSALRRLGYMDAHIESGIELDETLIATGPYTIEAGAEAARALLSHSDRPTAILAANDYIAIAAMSVARDQGLSIPGDVAVIGYNDVSLASLLPIRLSSVAVPLFEMGHRALELLMTRIAGDPIESVVLPVTLHERASSDMTRS